MPIPSSVSDLSTTASSNYPSGSESANQLDDYHRALCSIVRQVSDAKEDAGVAATAITAERTAVATLTNKTLVAPALGTPASGDLANCTFPTLNQNTTGTAANVSGAPALPNGTTATTQTAGDNSTKLATTAYVATATAAVSSPIKAWVTFNGSGTILASFGVASVVRNSTGNYTVTFSTPMVDAYYAAVATAKRSGTTDTNMDACLGHTGHQYDVNGFAVITRNSTAVTSEDASFVCVHVCR